MTGRLRQVGFRAAVELQPSFPPPLRSGSGSSSRSFKVIQKGHAATAQVYPEADGQFHFISLQHKNQAPKGLPGLFMWYPVQLSGGGRGPGQSPGLEV